MKENSQKFNILLESLDLSYDHRFDDGELEKIIINKDINIWNFYLSFPHILSLKDMEFLTSVIQTTYTNDEVKLVRVFYIFTTNQADKYKVEEYYQYFLNLCCEDKARYLVLRNYSTDFDDNVIKIYVGSQNEVEMVKSLSDRVMDYFKSYGINCVKIDVSISAFETPIDKVIEENLIKSTTKTIKEQEMYDRLSKNEKEPDKKEKVYKRPKLGSEMNGKPTKLSEVPASEVQVIEYTQKFGAPKFLVEGDVLLANIRDVKGYKIYEATLSDGTDSIIIKTFINSINNDEKFYREHCMEGYRIRVFGIAEYDKFSRDVVIKIKEINGLGEIVVNTRLDNAMNKRIELHAHTKMSTQDGVMDVEEYVKTALAFGHTALAVTDHYNTQSLPDLYNLTNKTSLKPIYGVEGALVDENKYKVALTNHDILLKDATYVVYDLETTGLSSNYNEIIEIAAVKVRNGMFGEEFSTFVKPKRPITKFITELTSITDDDVRDAKPIEEVIGQFKEYIEGCILVAHNATFDNSHLYKNLKENGIYEEEYPTIDTMQFARVKYGSKLKTFNLKALTKYFDVELSQHHRAIYDARATAEVFIKMLHGLEENHITNYNQINSLIKEEEAYALAHPTHMTILAKNLVGLKNLNKIISDSHTVHFFKEPRIIKKFLTKHREGLLIGSSCVNGEIFDVAYRDSYEHLLKEVEFYDYLEIQPIEAYLSIFEDDDVEFDTECIIDTVKKIIKAGIAKGKTVVATGDVHILNKEDEKLREIFINVPQVGGGLHKLYGAKHLPSQHFMTTDEMLQEFSYLGKDLAYELVVTNTNLIADQIEKFPLFPDKLYAPSDDFLKDRGVPSFKQAVIDLTYHNAHKRYGQELPPYIENRLKKELNSIIGNNYASIYYISHLLVKHSQDDGYVVGSRGSVGSSLVAFFMNITEVNGLAPHYYCKEGHFTAFKFTNEEKQIYPQDKLVEPFDQDLQSVGTGFDLPDAICPICGRELMKDGVDIPFETFLGFKGDKVPDIDLNFSGEYQSKAHEFTRELFGVDHAFRAGTISTIADKTAFGLAKGYLERKGIESRNSETARLANRITGVKRSTGQHPGGIVVIPKEIEYTDIIPVQYPADDTTSTWRTTHYDYHKFESNLLKLDILGHDDPTMIRHLMDFVEKEPDKFPFSNVDDIPLSDQEVIGIFSSVDSLKLDSNQVHEVIGTTGIPEFGTTLAKDMLREIRPKTVNELIKISGLSHGTDVWNGNARDYMMGVDKEVGPIDFKDLIGCRDDIMVYLLSKGLPAIDAFKIMESVRKGKGVNSDYEKEMLSYGVPKWYIASCKLIKYMFPKAHATAYVIMALRIAWFKVHRPLYYYAAYFSRRANAFDIPSMVGGYTAIDAKIKELEMKINSKQATAKDFDVYNCLLLALEMTARGYSFKQIDIEKSDWRDFLIDGDSLLIPFKAMESLGEATAKSITDARSQAMFSSSKDVMRRTKINSTVFERLQTYGVFKGLPEEDQIGLF